MKFFFCEKCGKRVTDSELDAGQAADKKLKGVYCRDCAIGVSTIEFQPLTRDEIARQNALKEKPAESHAGPAPSGSPNAVSPNRRTSTSQTRLKPVRGIPNSGGSEPGKLSQKAAVLWCMAGCLVLVVAVALALRSSPREPSTVSAKPAKPAATPTQTVRQPMEAKQPSLVQGGKRSSETDPKSISQDQPAKNKSKVESMAESGAIAEVSPSDVARSPVTGAKEAPADLGKPVDVEIPHSVQRPADGEPRAKPPATRDGMQPGLVAEYFKDPMLKQLVTKKVDPQVDFIWREPPLTGLPDKNYTVRWTGFLVVPSTGEYTFVMNRDNKVRMKLDGRWVLGGEGSFATTRKEMIVTGLNLQAGRLALQIEIVKTEGSQCELRWSGPHSGERVTVPAEALVHDPKDMK